MHHLLKPQFGAKPKSTHSCMTLAGLRSLGKEQAAMSGLAEFKWGILKSGLRGVCWSLLEAWF